MNWSGEKERMRSFSDSRRLLVLILFIVKVME